MQSIKLLALVTLCAALFSCSGQHSPPQTAAIEDTPEARRRAAEEYLRVVPPEELMKDTAEKLSANLPEPAKSNFLRAMTQDLDVNQLRTAMTNSMVNRFTVNEIDALARFYGSPEGKSVMKKFGLFMADVMPVIQAETMKAIAKTKEATQ